MFPVSAVETVRGTAAGKMAAGAAEVFLMLSLRISDLPTAEPIELKGGNTPFFPAAIVL